MSDSDSENLWSVDSHQFTYEFMMMLNFCRFCYDDDNECFYCYVCGNDTLCEDHDPGCISNICAECGHRHICCSSCSEKDNIKSEKFIYNSKSEIVWCMNCTSKNGRDKYLDFALRKLNITKGEFVRLYFIETTTKDNNGETYYYYDKGEQIQIVDWSSINVKPAR